MAIQQPKKGSKRSRARRPGAASKGKSRSKQVSPANKANSSGASHPGANHPRKPLPAWNEVEIDEQRENAGRPDPAFLPEEGYTDDDLAEELGEEFVLTATSGEQAAEDLRNQDVPEEVGGPFVETSGRTEFARGEDGSNPQDAEAAAFPTASSLDEPITPEDEMDSGDEEEEDAGAPQAGSQQPDGRTETARMPNASRRSGPPTPGGRKS
jgi:hypothetical protein